MRVTFVDAASASAVRDRVAEGAVEVELGGTVHTAAESTNDLGASNNSSSGDGLLPLYITLGVLCAICAAVVAVVLVKKRRGPSAVSHSSPTSHSPAQMYTNPTYLNKNDMATGQGAPAKLAFDQGVETAA